MSILDHFDKETQRFLENCIQCGLCAEGCPILSYTDISGVSSQDIQEGVFEFMESGIPNQMAYTKAFACMECFKCTADMCPEELNPMLVNELIKGEYISKGLANKAYSDAKQADSAQRVLASVQVSGSDYNKITRSGVKQNARYVFFAGCNVYIQPEKILNALDIMDAIGDDYAAHVRIIGEELGLHCRNWIIWHYTFGQQTKNKFARAHTHILYFVKDKKEFTFNEHAVRLPSDRQLIYNDKRANAVGKMPDDVWNTYSRVCGTFKERQGWHPCQMPELLLTRIIATSSNLGDLVLDPFIGSGTTAVAAKQLGRRYVGIDINEEYCQMARQRLVQIQPRLLEELEDYQVR